MRRNIFIAVLFVMLCGCAGKQQIHTLLENEERAVAEVADAQVEIDCDLLSMMHWDNCTDKQVPVADCIVSASALYGLCVAGVPQHFTVEVDPRSPGAISFLVYQRSCLDQCSNITCEACLLHSRLAVWQFDYTTIYAEQLTTELDKLGQTIGRAISGTLRQEITPSFLLVPEEFHLINLP